jgi:hypothetical protein
MTLTLRLLPVKRVRGRWITSGSRVIAAKVEGKTPLVGVISSSGVARYEHLQSSPSDLWTVNHNLGLKPVAVSVLSPGGVEVGALVSHISENQLTVAFAVPYTGSVRIL